MIGEHPRRPVRDTVLPGRRQQRRCDDPGPVHHSGPARAWPVLQVAQPRAAVIGPPIDHRLPRHPEPPGDLRVRHPVRGQQHDPRSLHRTRPDRGRPRPRHQPLPVAIRSKSGAGRAGRSHSPAPSAAKNLRYAQLANIVLASPRLASPRLASPRLASPRLGLPAHAPAFALRASRA